MTEPLPYSLSLAAALEPFRREIEYVFDVLDRWYAVARVPNAQRVIHYGDDAPRGALSIPNALFPSAITVQYDGLHLDRDRFAAIEAGKGTAEFLPNKASPDGLRYDAIGLIFFMLSRIEERGHLLLDRYGRFQFSDAFAIRKGSQARPLADIAARDLVRLIAGERVVGSLTEFGICPTHDVDRLRGYHTYLEPARNAIGDIVKRGNIGAAIDRLQSGYFGDEPWGSFRDIMNLSEARGLCSRFYFMGPTNISMDSPYVRSWPHEVVAVVEELEARGHRIGFHPGYATPEDPAEWNRQKRGLEQLLNRQLVEGRQHVLRYRIDTTPEIWSDAGMELDVTLSFPEQSGFRSGTCRRYQAYSLPRRQKLTVDRIDTAIMDFGLFGGKYRDLGMDAAIEEALTARDACREFGGELVILFHTGQPVGLKREFYKRLLDVI